MTQFPLVSFTFPYFDNIQIKEKNNTYYLLVLHFASFPAHQHNQPTPSPWRQNITVNKIACKTSLEKVTHCLVIFNWKVYLTCFHQETLDTDYYQGRCLIIYIKLLLLYSKNLFFLYYHQHSSVYSYSFKIQSWTIFYITKHRDINQRVCEV